MSQPVFETVCFLCDAPTKCRETDARNRRQFFCSSPSCGEYEISIDAMRLLEHDADFKAKASALANSVRDPNKIVEIIVSPTQQVSLTVVQRRPSP